MPVEWYKLTAKLIKEGRLQYKSLAEIRNVDGGDYNAKIEGNTLTVKFVPNFTSEASRGSRIRAANETIENLQPAIADKKSVLNQIESDLKRVADMAAEVKKTAPKDDKDAHLVALHKDRLDELQNAELAVSGHERWAGELQASLDELLARVEVANAEITAAEAIEIPQPKTFEFEL